ncbi:Structural maintenance of chromosomes protein 6 [Orchesella cincta]|uniref:Structural maintenance of chromosomes protein 6 n=1 Tax=Orchesella cincta TaxID=48709 RepID=A0A1D2M7C1_ORCCI|nr:Structural maintenance of chromosomes protein 6 [Orchesella cincta]
MRVTSRSEKVAPTNGSERTTEGIQNGEQQPTSSTAVRGSTSRKKIERRGRTSPFSSDSEGENEDTVQQAEKSNKNITQLKRVGTANDAASDPKKRKNDPSMEPNEAVQGSSTNHVQKGKRKKKSTPNALRTTLLTKKLKTNAQHNYKERDTDSSLSEASGDEAAAHPLADTFSQPSQSIPLSQVEGPYAGVIKSLRLQNFMCHSDFTHNFHPNLNFITGQNGSGKSALLSGILIALGGKASVTSRTTSLKSLIQKGKSIARVTVTLLNRNGVERYGEEITIERKLSAAGGGSYKIKSTGGKNAFGWKQLKKTELDNLLVALNIQIDNPVAVLNQEVARGFLRSKDPKAKYKLFYQGTLLSKLETTIDETQECIEETSKMLFQQRTLLLAMRKEIEQLKKKCDKIRELEVIKDKVNDLNREYLWSLVIQQEKLVDEAARSTDTASKNLDRINKTLGDAEIAYENLNEDSVLEEFASLREQVRDKKQELSDTRNEMAEVKKTVIQLQARLKAATSAVTSKQTMIDKVTAQIQRRTAEQQAKIDEGTHRDTARGQELEGQKKQLEAVINAIKTDGDNFQLAADKEREKLHELDNDGRRLRAEIETRKRSITALSSKANKYAAFGKEMETLMAKIEANMQRFTKRPRGPLGALIRVKDPKYAGLIEVILGQNLHSFVVDNLRDCSLLTELIDSTYREGSASQRTQRQSKVPGIIKSIFADQMYDISRHSASHPGTFTVLDMIEVENNDHIVINALIDISNIEKLLLFKTNSDAAQVMKRQSTCPRHLLLGYTLEGFKFSPAPNYAARVIKHQERARYLKSGKGREHEVAALKADIKQLEVDLKSLDPKRAELQANENSMRRQYKGKMDELTATRRQLSELEELAELKEDLESQLAIRDSATKELEPQNPKLMDLENAKKKKQEEFDALSSKLGAFEEQRDKYKTRKSEAANVIRKLKVKQTQLEGEHSKFSKDLAVKEKELQEKTNNALGVSERLDTPKTPAQLQKENESLKICIRETEAQLGDVDALQSQLYSKKQKYRVYFREYAPLRQMLSIIKRVSETQRASLELMKVQMGRTLHLFFEAMTKQRGYEGRLILDMVTEELYYFVCPDGGSASKTLKAIDAQLVRDEDRAGAIPTAEQNRKNKELRRALVEYSLGLSGGERSFATICFIMALWQAMECPFYMLDEFDVFMDAFNRKTSQMALIANAKKCSNFQYILFTPLDLSEVPAPEDACVLRLFPPVRTGARGGPSNAPGSTEETQSAGAPEEGSSNSPGGSVASDNIVENVDPLVEVVRTARLQLLVCVSS